MADHQHTDNPFVKWFLPGLIVGLIVGMAAGAFLQPFTEKAPVTLVPNPGATRSNEPRDPAPKPITPAVEAPKTEPVPADPATKAEPTKPATPGEVKPAGSNP